MATARSSAKAAAAATKRNQFRSEYARPSDAFLRGQKATTNAAAGKSSSPENSSAADS